MSNGKIDTSPSLTGWRKLLDDTIAGVAGIPQGLIGIEPEGTGVGPTANKLTQLLTNLPMGAGLPFSQLMKGKSVFHGTNKSFSKFNPSKYNERDLLGQMTHFAEDPVYAANYAERNIGGSPNIIPAHIEAQNTLDLFDPNWEDLAIAMEKLSPEKRNQVRQLAQDEMRRMGRTPEKAFGVALSRIYSPRSYGEGNPLSNTPFDAIRYNDIGNPSWAVPQGTTIRTPWGTSLK